ncbi:hypothetical protein GCM10028819_51520 [Spirosoma humi]
MNLEKTLTYNRIFSIIAVVLLFITYTFNDKSALKEALSIIVPISLFMNFFIKKKITESETGHPVPFNIKRIAFEVIFLSVALINFIKLVWL